VLSEDNINWQKAIFSVISRFNIDDDDAAVGVNLFSNRDETLQIAFSMTSGDFPLIFRCTVKFFFLKSLETFNTDEEILFEQSEIESLKKYKAF